MREHLIFFFFCLIINYCSDVLPFIEKLEKEWLLQKVQLKKMSDDGFVGRLGFPLGLVQQIREEIGVVQPQVPGMLKYKVIRYFSDTLFFNMLLLIKKNLFT